MELNEVQLNALEGLVNELLKPTPEEDKIQSFMKTAGIEDPVDPVSRIQSVLNALRFEHPKQEFE